MAGALFGFGFAGVAAPALTLTAFGHGFLWRNGVFVSDRSLDLMAALFAIGLAAMIAGAVIAIVGRKAGPDLN